MQEQCIRTESLRGVVERLGGSPSSPAIAARGAAAAAYRGKGAVNHPALQGWQQRGNGVALQ